MIVKLILPDKFGRSSIAVGVTGGIGSGKTTFCRMIAEKGYPILNADSIAKDIMSSEEKVISSIEAQFGREAYLGGKLNREYLADKVFKDTGKVKILNDIVHPAVIEKSRILLEELMSTNRLVFYEAALIFEANMQHLFDAVVIIIADQNKKLNRVIARDNTTADKVQNRMRSQSSDDEKIMGTGIIVSNNAGIAELEADAMAVIQLLSEKLAL